MITRDATAKIYHMQLIYSLHTFTRGVKEGETPDKDLLYCVLVKFFRTPR